jgi:hypothetical protein
MVSTRWTIFVSFLCLQLYLGYSGTVRRREGRLLGYSCLLGSWACCVFLPGGIYLLGLAVYAAFFDNVALHVPIILAICGAVACSFFVVCARGARASFHVAGAIKSGPLDELGFAPVGATCSGEAARLPEARRQNFFKRPEDPPHLAARTSAYLPGQECVICLLADPPVDAGCCHAVCTAGFHARCLQQHFAYRSSESLYPAELCPVCQSGLSSEPRPARRRDAEPRQAEDEDIEEVGLDHSFLSVSLSAQDNVEAAEAAEAAKAAAVAAEAPEAAELSVESLGDLEDLEAMQAGGALEYVRPYSVWCEKYA